MRRSLPGALLALAVLAAPSTHAQWLNLDPPAAPRVDELDGPIETLARELDESIAALMRERRSLDGAARESIDARIAARRIAGALLRAGTGRAGVGAEAPIVAGLRIRSILDRFDTVADASFATKAPPSVHAFVRVRLRAFTERAARFDAPSLPDWPAVDAALAQLFGELADSEIELLGRTLTGGWPLDPRAAESPDASTLRERFAAEPWSDATRESLSAMLDALAGADAHVTLQPAIADSLIALARAADAGANLPQSPWLPSDQRTAILARLDTAVAAWARPDSRRDARAALESATLHAEIAAQIDVAMQSGADDTSMRSLFEGASTRLISPRLTDDDRRALTALRHYLDDVAWSRPRLRRDGWSRDETRPAWGALAPHVRTAEESAGADLLEALRDPRALQRPAVISALVNHRDTVEALRRLERSSDILAALESGADGASNAAATGVRRLIDAHLDEALRAWAVRQLARFEEQFRAWFELPDCGIDALDDEARRLRTAWLESWADGEPAAEPEALAPCAVMLRLVDSVRSAAALGDDANIHTWSGLDAAAPFLIAESARQRDALNTTVREFLGATPEARAAVASDAARDASIPITLAAIERSLAAVWDDNARAGAVARLAIPPSARSWLATSRDDLGALARWSVELDAAATAQNIGRAQDIRDYLAPVCSRLIDAATLRP